MKTIQNNQKDQKDQLIQFCENQDYAFCWGAGIMYANDDEERQMVVEHLNQDGIIIEAVGVEECEELACEIENGCIIYKAYKWNEEAMYIAYYK